MKIVEFTDKEYMRIQKVKLKDPLNKNHHRVVEFLLRCVKCYNEKIKNT